MWRKQIGFWAYGHCMSSVGYIYLPSFTSQYAQQLLHSGDLASSALSTTDISIFILKQVILIAKMLANHLDMGMRSFVPFQNSALSIIDCNIIWLSALVYECIHKQCTYYAFKQQMAEQSLNKKHPDFKSTAETFVQIYKEKKQSFRHHETFVINRFVWNQSLSSWTSLPNEAGRVLYGSGVQSLLRNIFGAKLNFASRNSDRAMKYWLRVVNTPRLVELDDADTFPNLHRT